MHFGSLLPSAVSESADRIGTKNCPREVADLLRKKQNSPVNNLKGPSAHRSRQNYPRIARRCVFSVGTFFYSARTHQPRCGVGLLLPKSPFSQSLSPVECN